jgi:hypothetical protein
MSFIDFARIHGVEIDPSRFYASDRIHRTGTVGKPRSGNGAYWWDGRRGWVQDWSGESRVIWYEDPHAKPWSDEDRRAWVEKRRAQQDDQKRRYERAEVDADRTLKSAHCESHAYLEIKGFKDEVGLVLDGKLLIPMRNVSTQRLQGYQAIQWDGEARKYEKKMQTGMRAKDAVFLMGSRRAEEVWL